VKKGEGGTEYPQHDKVIGRMNALAGGETGRPEVRTPSSARHTTVCMRGTGDIGKNTKEQISLVTAGLGLAWVGKPRSGILCTKKHAKRAGRVGLRHLLLFVGRTQEIRRTSLWGENAIRIRVTSVDRREKVY